MSSWRDRLCGSEVAANAGEGSRPPLRQFINPGQSISCGGGFFPANHNIANMKTVKSSFLLPTKSYSVLIFRDDGSAVIYSDEEPGAVRETDNEPKTTDM
ncbi:MAG: hypothetical protein HQM16_16900 [Deltaproteobacteria bacterium]|nr:hypothetical protein [Deltaproteobacteria bacterium]